PGRPPPRRRSPPRAPRPPAPRPPRPGWPEWLLRASPDHPWRHVAIYLPRVVVLDQPAVRPAVALLAAAAGAGHRHHPASHATPPGRRPAATGGTADRAPSAADRPRLAATDRATGPAARAARARAGRAGARDRRRPHHATPGSAARAARADQAAGSTGAGTAAATGHARGHPTGDRTDRSAAGHHPAARTGPAAGADPPEPAGPDAAGASPAGTPDPARDTAGHRTRGGAGQPAAVPAWRLQPTGCLQATGPIAGPGNGTDGLTRH